MRWKTHSAAIAETNRNAMSAKICAAEAAVVARSRKLFNESGADVDCEREALEDALHALRALRGALEWRTAA